MTETINTTTEARAAVEPVVSESGLYLFVVAVIVGFALIAAYVVLAAAIGALLRRRREELERAEEAAWVRRAQGTVRLDAALRTDCGGDR